MTIGENIKQLRERFGLSQLQLGEIAGVSDKAVSTWEKGTNVPRMGVIQKMADYFGITKSEIIEGPKPKEKPTPEDELDDELVSLLSDLTHDEVVRVLDFVSGLKAAREVAASHNK